MPSAWPHPGSCHYTLYPPNNIAMLRWAHGWLGPDLPVWIKSCEQHMHDTGPRFPINNPHTPHPRNRQYVSTCAYVCGPFFVHGGGFYFSSLRTLHRGNSQLDAPCCDVRAALNVKGSLLSRLKFNILCHESGSPPSWGVPERRMNYLKSYFALAVSFIAWLDSVPIWTSSLALLQAISSHRRNFRAPQLVFYAKIIETARVQHNYCRYRIYLWRHYVTFVQQCNHSTTDFAESCTLSGQGSEVRP